MMLLQNSHMPFSDHVLLLVKPCLASKKHIKKIRYNLFCTPEYFVYKVKTIEKSDILRYVCSDFNYHKGWFAFSVRKVHSHSILCIFPEFSFVNFSINTSVDLDSLKLFLVSSI